MKKCPYCAEEIQDEAIVCKHCGRDLRVMQRPPQQTSVDPSAASKSTRNALLFILGAILGGIFICYLFSGSGSGGQPTVTPDDGRSSAFYACEEFSKNYLVSPKSADYPRYDSSFVTKTATGEFLVNMYVDSKNKLGVDIRSTLICQIAHEGDKWRLVDIKIE